MAQYTLTAATCEPASTSASISARLLYCCGDSITISLLGALPARPCMVVTPACVCSLWSGVRLTARMLPWRKSCPQCGTAERALPTSSQIPSVLSHNSPASLSLSPALSLIRRGGPLPPSQLCSCERVCGYVCVCVCMYTMWFVWGGGGEEKSTTPPLKT